MLSIQHLSISFNDVKAVDDISLDIFSNKITALVGESGSGKSLTALSILQLLTKDAQINGCIEFNTPNHSTVDLLAISKKEIQKIRGNRISMIFQEPMSSLNPRMKVGVQVSEGIRLHKSFLKKQARIETLELFQKVGLPDPSGMYDRYPHELSGGQKQRVMIAMAIACKPTLLIADEPTTALDVRVQKSILDLLKKLQQETGMSILLITHDLGIVADYADEVLVMHAGKIVENGTTESLLKLPQHAYTKKLLESRDLSTVRQEMNISEKDKPILQINHLSFAYQKPRLFFKAHKNSTLILDDINLSVHKGEMLGIVGESGSGKTTLGRCILGLVSGYQGVILFDGTPIYNQKSSKKVQVVFQDPYGSLNPHITIGDAIREPLKVHGLVAGRKAQTDRVVELLESVQLNATHLSRYPHQFSGGQRQRICIARALSVNPDLMIFDESISALDMYLQKQIIQLILELKSKRNFTCLFISHDLRLVSSVCDRIAVMHSGKIIEVGDAGQIFKNPIHPYTQSLDNAIPGKKFFHN